MSDALTVVLFVAAGALIIKVAYRRLIVQLGFAAFSLAALIVRAFEGHWAFVALNALGVAGWLASARITAQERQRVRDTR